MVNFFHRIHWISYKKETAVHVFEPLISCMSTASYSTAPSVTYFIDISCEFKSDSINVMKNKCVKILQDLRFLAVIFLFSPLKRWKKSPLATGSGENKNFTALNRKSYENSPQKIYSDS